MVCVHLFFGFQLLVLRIFACYTQPCEIYCTECYVCITMYVLLCITYYTDLGVTL